VTNLHGRPLFQISSSFHLYMQSSKEPSGIWQHVPRVPFPTRAELYFPIARPIWAKAVLADGSFASFLLKQASPRQALNGCHRNFWRNLNESLSFKIIFFFFYSCKMTTPVNTGRKSGCKGREAAFPPDTRTLIALAARQERERERERKREMGWDLAPAKDE